MNCASVATKVTLAGNTYRCRECQLGLADNAQTDKSYKPMLRKQVKYFVKLDVSPDQFGNRHRQVCARSR